MALEQFKNGINLPFNQATDTNVSFNVPGRFGDARQYLGGLYQQASEYGLKPLANDYQIFSNDLLERDKYYQNISDVYNQFGGYLSKKNNERGGIYDSMRKDLLGRLSNNYLAFQNTYGPEGSLTTKVTDYYKQLGDFLLKKQSNERLAADGTARRYGLSDNARDIATNDVIMKNQAETLKAFDGEVKQIDDINRIYNQLLDNSFKNYKGVQDEYLKQQTDSNYGQQTQLAESLFKIILNNEAVKNQLAKSTGATRSNGSSNPNTSQLQQYMQMLQQQGGQQQNQSYATPEQLASIAYQNSLKSNLQALAK